MSKGFQRLRNAAACGAMGLGLLGAGSGRASMVNTGYQTGASYNLANGNGAWGRILNYGLMFNSNTQTTSNGFNISFPAALDPSNQENFPEPEWIKGFVLLDGSVKDGANILDDAFDSALHLAVGGTLFMNPAGEVDITGKTLTTGKHRNIIPGVDAHVQFHFSDGTGAPTVVRAMYTLVNTSNADISTSALVAGNLGSDEYTTIKDSFNGTASDTTISDADLWYITDDNSDYGDGNDARSINSDDYWDPKILLVRYGEDASVAPINVMTPGTANSVSFPDDIDNFGLRYDVTIPAGDSVRILVFAGLYADVGSAQFQAPQFESIGGLNGSLDLLADLSDQDLRKTVNFGIATDLDLDGDNVTGTADNCLRIANIDQADSDGDGVGDACDVFPDNADESLDSDGDGVGDKSDALPFNPRETQDSDGDGIGNINDNCPAVANSNQADADSNGTGDVCEGGTDGGSGGGGAMALPPLLAALTLWLGGLRRRRNHR